MRVVAFIVMVPCLAASLVATAIPDRAFEVRRSLLDRPDAPNLKFTVVRETKWALPPGEDKKPSYVPSLTQRLWRSADETEMYVEAAVFASHEDALKAAEHRVKVVKDARKLQDEALPGGPLPGLGPAHEYSGQGDRVWGLLDPPEPGRQVDPRKGIAPVSTLAVVVFVCRDAAVQVSAENHVKGVKMSDVEDLARKVAAKMNAPTAPVGQREQKK